MPDTDPNTEQPTVPESVDEVLKGLDFAPEEEAEKTPAPDAKDEAEAPAEEAASDEPDPDAEPEEAAEAPAEPADEAETVPTSEEEPAEEEKPAPKAPPAEPRKGVTAADQAAQQRQQREARLAEIKGEIRKITDSPDYDPFEDAKKINRLRDEKDDLLEQKQADLEAVISQQQYAQQVEQTWTQWGAEHPAVGTTKAKQIFAEEMNKLAKKFPGSPADSLQIAATQAWETRVNLIEAQARAAAAKKAPAKPAPGKPAAKLPVKPPVTKGGGKVMPTGAAPARPAPSKDPEDVLAAAISGGVKGLLG